MAYYKNTHRWRIAIICHYLFYLMSKDITLRETWAYIAGLIDADGSICLMKRDRVHFKPMLAFSNNNEEVVRWVADVVDKKYSQWIDPRGGNKKTMHVLNMQGRNDVYTALMAMEPFLVRKKEQAQLCIEYHGLHEWKQGMRVPLTDREKEIYSKMKALNKVGRGRP